LSEEDMAALYRAADIYCQPSYGESFGLAALEACACGRPVVATAWGGVLSFLDGSNAWLVDYELVDASRYAYDWKGPGAVRMAKPRVESLAEALRCAYEDASARSAKGEAAAAKAVAFPWSGTAEAVLARLGR
jgi:D-inositol-3-phosphate glycosyltransferase